MHDGEIWCFDGPSDFLLGRFRNEIKAQTNATKNNRRKIDILNQI